MRNTIKGFLLGVVITLGITGIVFANDGLQTIQVEMNKIKLSVNGVRVNADNILYNNTTYVPIRKVAEMLGMQVQWDDNSTANINRKDIVENDVNINSKKSPEGVSLINLIATPEKYDGLYVRLIGVGRVEFEGNSLFLSKEHFDNRVSKNALWLSFDSTEVDEEEISKWNGKYVIVEGKFNMYDRGHMGLSSGSIDDITRYDLW